MSDNKQIVREFIKALGEGDVAHLGTLLTQDVAAVCTGTSVLSGTRSYSEVCSAAGMLKSVAPQGIDFQILHLTAEADRVAAEVAGKATLINGTPYNNQYHFLFFLRDGRIFKITEYMDTKLVDAALGPLLRAGGG
jgi:ketosteroid isomerase-like protein